MGDNDELTQEGKQQRLDDATAALFASLFEAPRVSSGKAKELIEARQAKAAGAALAALAGLNG